MEGTQRENTARIAVSDITFWVDRPYTYAIPPRLAGQVQPGVRVAVPFGGSRPKVGLVLAMGGETEKKLREIMEVLDQEPLLSPDQLKLALWIRERFFCPVMDVVQAMLPKGLWYHVWPVYLLPEGLEQDQARQRAEGSAENLVLDTVFGHGGRCELEEIESVFGSRNPGPALASLVRKGVLLTAAGAERRVGERTLLQAELAVSPQQAREAAERSSRAVRQGAILRLLADLECASVADLCYFTGAGRDAVKRLADKGLVRLVRRRVYRRPQAAGFGGGEEPLPVLNEEQQRALEGLLALADGKSPRAALLFGVTGSGKTTVYIHLIHALVRQGRTAILLVPEIALTPQMLQTFSTYFGDGIAVLHSALSMGERYDEYQRIRQGQARVVIGTRSAIFAPLSQLGVIILDEEQEYTYKSDRSPRYHARDVAKYLCVQNRALLLLGSATPDVASRYAADQGRYAYFTLLHRYNALQMPRVQIVDMKEQLRSGNQTTISTVLRGELEDNLRRGDQSILFLNRRGASKLVTCLSCGYTYQCPNCSANLTYHSVGNRLMCHYCGYTRRVDSACPRCGGKLAYTGAGTQKVVEELEQLFPGTGILRMDSDSVAPVGSHRTMFEQFRTQRIPILVGTQMVTKGLNFENVTLVGVLNADMSLYAPDYRAGERTFSLITQVIGRSGRFEKPGRAVIQTFTPENQIIVQAARQDYESFYQGETALRKLTGTPPYTEMFVLTAAGKDQGAVVSCCEDLCRNMRQLTAQQDQTRVLGPAPLPIARVSGVWRYRVTVSGPDYKQLHQAVTRILLYANGKYRGVSIYADYDPID